MKELNYCNSIRGNCSICDCIDVRCNITDVIDIFIDRHLCNKLESFEIFNKSFIENRIFKLLESGVTLRKN